MFWHPSATTVNVLVYSGNRSRVLVLWIGFWLLTARPLHLLLK